MPESRVNILAILRLQSSVDDIKSGNFWKALIAESVGTFILVFIGLGSCYGDSKLLGAAFGFGLGGALGIWTIATISGGNINPAVSLGLLIARKMSLVRCLCYMVFQFFGSLAASKIILIMTEGSFDRVHGISKRHVPPEKAFFCEIVVTFLLVFTVMRMCVDKSRSETERGVAPLAIGISIIVGILGGGHISGGSMNPARSLGPAVANMKFTDIWIYVAGPLVGGSLAGLLQQVLFTSELSKQHLVDYLISPYFDSCNKYRKVDGDTESNHSIEKQSFKPKPKMSPKLSPKQSSEKSTEKHELLEENRKLEEVSEIAT